MTRAQKRIALAKKLGVDPVGKSLRELEEMAARVGKRGKRAKTESADGMIEVTDAQWRAAQKAAGQWMQDVGFDDLVREASGKKSRKGMQDVGFEMQDAVSLGSAAGREMLASSHPVAEIFDTEVHHSELQIRVDYKKRGYVIVASPSRFGVKHTRRVWRAVERDLPRIIRAYVRSGMIADAVVNKSLHATYASALREVKALLKQEKVPVSSYYSITQY